MNRLLSVQAGKWALHVGAWIVYLLLYATLWRDLGVSFQGALLHNIILLPCKILLVYATLLYLVPRFLARKKYTAFIVGLFSFSILAALLNQLYLQNILHMFHPGERFWDLEILSKRLTHLNSPLFIALTFEGIKMNAQLSREKLNAELALLRNQLQPHFFFNTLNNLYSLVIQKSDLAPDLILKLSDMMRYILYDSSKESVKLEEEVKFIRDFIAIEQIRYGKKVKVLLDIPESLPPIQLPPLILFTFIENAFKHGVAHEIDEAWIQINLDVNHKTLLYTVKNSKPLKKESVQIETRGGIGLKNTEQRLRITYGDRYKFHCSHTPQSFEAFLSIVS